MSRSRVGKVVLITLGGLVALVATAVLGASVVLQGPRLGALIEGALPENRGKLQIGGVGWGLGALADLITDTPSPISLDGLKIIDPEGTVVLDVPHLEAKVKLRTLIAGSFSIHDLKVGKALWRFAQMSQSEEIGFVAALQPKHAAPLPPAGAVAEPQGPGTFFQIVNGDLADLNAIFDFPGSWGLELRHARAAASLIQSTVDPKHPVFGFDCGPIVAEGGGWLRILDDNLLPFDKVIINRISTTQDRPDDIFLDLREARTGKTALVGKGYFTGIYGATSVPGAALHVQFHDAADALNQVVAGKKIEGLLLSGDISATADLRDTFAKLKVTAKFAGMDVSYAPYRALGVGFGLTFDGGAMKIGVRDFHLGAPGGGRLGLDATFDATAMKVAADVNLKDFTTDSYVPVGLQAISGGHLNGGFHAEADLGPAGQSGTVRGLDLTLVRRRAAGLPTTIRVHGDAAASAARFKTSGLTVEVPGATATASGEVRLARQTVALALDVLAYDLARVLAGAGLPPLGKTARITAKADGAMASPTVGGTASVTGLGVGKRVVPELRAQFGLEGGLARLDASSTDLFGGDLRARGTVRLYEKTTRRMLKSPVVDLNVTAHHVDVGAAAGSDLLSGRLSLEAQLRGPVESLSGSVRIPGEQPLVVAGEALILGPVEVALEGRTVTVKELRVARRAGGRVNISGTAGMDGPRPLALDVELEGLTLAGLPGVAETGLDVKGVVGAKLHLSGSAERPRIAGTIELSGVAARGIVLGDGQIDVAPDDTVDPAGRTPGVVALTIKGDLFERFHVDARVAQKAAGLSMHATVEFSKLVLESLLPELVALGDGHGRSSGRVQVDLEPGKPLLADVMLTELWVSLARAVDEAPGESTQSTLHRVELAATKPVHVTLAGDRVTLDELSLATQGGDLHAHGVLDGRKVQAAVKGHLDLELLQPFVGAFAQKISGDLDVALDAGGTIDKPDLRGSLTIQDPIHLRPLGFDMDIVVASGAVALDSGAAEVRKLKISVDGATTEVDGRVTLGAGFRPQAADAHVAGEISARLLGSLAGETVAEAHGRARVKADIKGRLDNPEVNAWLALDTVSFRLRDTGTLVEVQSGVVELTNSGALLRDVRVLIDEQGKLVIGAAGVRPGQLEIKRLVPLELGRLDFPLHGEQLSYRSPGSFEMNDLAFDLDLGGDLNAGFQLGGEVRIIAGRYVQDFKMSNLVLSPRVDESAVRPFYEGKPLLENLNLDLTVRTVGDAFVVQNNIAPEIHIDVALHVGGTLSAPRLAGDVRPTDGRFRIPVLRGDFDLVPNVNHVTFVETKSVADGDTPDIQIEAQNQMVDAAGADHTVNMNIHGPVREMQIDLSTTDGLDRSQTAFLLLTGRTTAASDRATTQNPTVGANVNTGLDIAGQATRDTIANLMEPIIGDTFERAVGAQLRLTVGPDGFEERVTKRISRYMKFQVEALQGFQGSARQTLQFDQWLFDYITFTIQAQRLVIPQQPGLTETTPVNGSLELRWDFAIRR
ncbi:MAG: translocation/assembly module TamB domain-containing protein [Polyangia bacterium]